ncbi:MAG: sialidase family protein [Candidatus Dormiibacterota bacterium]
MTNPLNGKELLLGSDDFNCPYLGFHLSRDEGSTWTRVECMLALIIKHRTYVPMDEPSVGYDLNGTAYISGIYFFNTQYGTDYGLVAVQKSSDGTHWSKPVVAMRRPGATTEYSTHLAVDTNVASPWVNRLYVSGVALSDQNIKNQVLVSHSSDGGASWMQVAVDAVQKSPVSDTLTRMTVAKDGTVYVTWLRCHGSGEQRCNDDIADMMFSKSSDGAKTWSSPGKIAQVTMPVDWALPNTYERVYNYPDIVADNGDGPYSGNLYVAMYTWTGAYLRVEVIRSTDGGTAWSQPVHLTPKSDTHDQFFPAISVNSTGKVGVSWLDRRNDPNDVDYQAFAAISEDGGQSFGANWQLTTAFSDPRVNGTENNWMGDYTGNTWSGDTFIAAWMDSSNGVDMQEEVGGVRLK